VGLNTVIDAGAGDDTVAASGFTTPSSLFVYLGAGNDSLTLINARAFAAFLYGGTGSNTLTTDAATRTGVRTLRSFQFQNTTV
jgi:Ca2+-binding RTX toxin-like protein